MPAATETPTRITSSVDSAATSERLVSLDALRGFDMFWIVGGGAFFLSFGKLGDHPITQFIGTQLKHVQWEGFVFYDLIFPLFLFIIGASMVFSLEKALATGGRAAVIFRVFRRSLLLFALGVFRSGGLTNPWPDVSLGGVLHRIAVCYLAAALIYCFVRNAPGLLGVAVVILVWYWGMVTFIPFPDLKLDKATVDALADKVGSHSPAVIAAAVPERIAGVYEERRNLSNYVDFLYLPGKKAELYYINEGLLSTLPSIALPLFGAIAGLLLRNRQISPQRKTAYLLAGGLVAMAIGLAWSFQFPLIKRIWSSSFVLVATGLSSLLLAAFYYVIEVLGRRTWCQPFVWIGCNAITLYLAVSIINFRDIALRLVGGDVKQYFNSHLAEGAGDVVVATVSILLVFALARFLYVRKIFLRV